MKRFYITLSINNYLDSYSEGEIGHVGYYEQSNVVRADNPTEAVKNYVENILVYKVDEDSLSKVDDVPYALTGSWMIDEDGTEPTEFQLEKFRNNEIQLWVSSIEFYVYELQAVEF